MKKMSVRERMLAVIQGKKHDKMPFVQYDNLIIPDKVFLDRFGRGNVGILKRSSVTKWESNVCSIESHDIMENGLKGKASVLHTPKGDLSEKILFTSQINSPARVEYYVKKPEDYELLLEYFNDITVVENTQRFLGDMDHLGEDGLPMVCVSRTPYQQMWIWWVSLMNFGVDIFEYVDIVEACLDRLGEIKKKELEIVADTAKKVHIPIVNFPDNITAPMIGQKLFKKYCVEFYDMAADMLSGTDTLISVHMDGDLKPLAELIGSTKIGGLDSFTPTPDNDTGLDDALIFWPDLKIFMNFPSSVHIADGETIYNKACELLEQTKRSGRVWMQISEDLPPGMWEKSFPKILRAIDEYGPPMA